jgi:opacity protein-like surface antigen
MKHVLRWAVAFLAVAVHATAWALINPNFTPADLVGGSTTIVELQLGSDGQVSDLKLLKGNAPTQLRLTVDESARESLPDGKHPALLFLANLAAAGETTEATPPVGAVHTRDGWLGLYAGQDGGYTLAPDKRDLKAVWAGSTAMLGRALKYVLAGPGRATFPVKVGVAWRGETNVVKFAQPIAGLQAVELTPSALPVLHILSPAGDRLGPAFLFNRGFRTFGTADELTLAGAEVDGKVLEAGNAFNSGAPYGVAADFDGDGAQDGAFATADGDVWMVWRDRGAACHGLLLAVPPGAGPVRVTLTDGQTLLGALLAVPGRPAYCGFAAKGGVKLAWTGSDGKPRTRTVPAIKPLTRVELTD